MDVIIAYVAFNFHSSVKPYLMFQGKNPVIIRLQLVCPKSVKPGVIRSEVFD